MPPPQSTLFFLDVGLDNMDNPYRSGRVMSLSLSPGASPQTLVENERLPDGIDVFDDRIYWTVMGTPRQNDGCIRSCKLDGIDVETIVPNGAVHTPKQLVIEPGTRKLYFCDREGMRIWRCGIDGSDLEVLIQTGVPSQVLQPSNPLNWPIGLALDISTRMIYWTQKGPSKGNQGRLFRASLEIPAGRSVSQRTDIQCLLSGLPEPIDLDFDAHTRMLYWTDRGKPPLGGTLNRICIDEFGEFEGSGMEMGIGTRQTKTAEARHVVMRKLNEPIRLKLDRRIGHVYVADMSG